METRALVTVARKYALRCCLLWGALVPAAFAQGTRVNAPVVPGGYVGAWKISASGSRAFYAGWQTTVDVNEIHDVPLDGSQATRILSAPFLPGRGCFPYLAYQVSPDDARVLYLADHDADEQFELYSVPTDGTRVSTKLSGPMIPQGDVQLDFRWTPNGTRVLYRADATADNSMRFYSSMADGSVAPVQLHPQFVQKFQITPDSSRAVFGSGQLYSAPVDGSAPSQQLSSSAETDFVGDFAITPDAQRVVFVGGYFYYDPLSEDDIAYGLYSVPVGGGTPALELLTPIEASFSISSPPAFQITQDSTRVVYHSTIDGRLFSLRVDGLEPPLLLNPGTEGVSFFSVSPDGSTVALVTFSGGGARLYSVPVNGSAGPTLLTSSFLQITKPDISSLGVVVFIAWVGGVYELYSVPIDGSQAPTRLSGTMAAGGGVWDAASTGIPSYWISPDGRWVLYKADQDTNDVVELFCAPFHGRYGAWKVSGPLVAGGDTYSVTFVPGSRRIVYNADQETDGATELFTSAYGVGGMPHGQPQLGAKGLNAAGNPGSATVTAP